MKCDDCLNLLETYLDGEASERETDQVRAHLSTCLACENQFEALTAENEIYASYDRELNVSPAVWNGIAARIATEDRQSGRGPKVGFTEWLSGLFAVPSLRFAMPTVALVAIAVVVGVAYWKMRPAQPTKDNTANVNSLPPSIPGATEQPPTPASPVGSQGGQDRKKDKSLVASAGPRHTPKPPRVTDQSDVLPDANDTDLADRDTASHLEQAQNLLVSFRSLKYSDDDQEVDVSYEKAESRRLLSENVVLRRDAEMSGKFPAKSMLGSLEPFLIDIANLPDKAKPSDVREITDRVQKTEIVAELKSY